MAGSVVLTSILLICALPGLCRGGPGTTTHLRDIFLGRCFDLQETRPRVTSVISKKDCRQLYNVFKSSVKLETNCSTNFSNAFDNFFKFIDPGLTGKNKAVFWSGTHDLAHELSNANDDYTTLEDTFPGYIANNLRFCGGNASGDFNFTLCACSWDSSISKAFWNGASKQFAKNAQGVVNVLVNGTRRDGNPAYRGNSIFAKVELPNMNASLVEEIKILVGWDLNTKPLERCGAKSIKKLQEDIKKKKIKVTCIDEPRAAFYILCAKYPTSSACRRHQAAIEKESKTWALIGRICIGTTISLLVLSVTLGVILYWKVKRKPTDQNDYVHQE